VWRVLQQYIEREARKRLKRLRREQTSAKNYQTRYRLRTGSEPKASTQDVPGYWKLDRHFDPLYCIAHSKFLAKGVWRSLKQNAYVPRPAYQVRLPKPDGTSRQIRIFTIPDAAISNLFARNLIRRNSRIFSAASYAYRPEGSERNGSVMESVGFRSQGISTNTQANLGNRFAWTI